MSRAYTLVDEHISDETVEMASYLADGAADGEIIGLAVVVVFKRRRYIVDCAGEACRDPTMTRGMVAALDDQLRELQHGKSFDHTQL